MKLETVAVANYRSLRDLRVPVGRLNLVTGGNGVGKSNLYKALEILHHAASGRLASALVREGGMPSVQWAGPERALTAAAKRRGQKVVGTVRTGPVRVRFGVAFDSVAYALTLGLPTPPPPGTPPGPFGLDPLVKEEWIFHAVPRRPSNTWLERDHGHVTCQDADGSTRSYDGVLETESVLSQLHEPSLFPELHFLREALRGFRFYHSFRTDAESPLRAPQVGTFTPTLASSGEDFAAALVTIDQVGDGRAMRRTIRDALHAELEVSRDDAYRFDVMLRVDGLLRPLAARELSDGTLKFLALVAALYSPRPAPLIVLNEPEASLHPDLIDPLAAAIVDASKAMQVLVVSHHPALVARLERERDVVSHRLIRDDEGATGVEGQGLLDVPLFP